MNHEYRVWSRPMHSAVPHLQGDWPFVAAGRRDDIHRLQPKSDVGRVRLRDGQRLECGPDVRSTSAQPRLLIHTRSHERR